MKPIDGERIRRAIEAAEAGTSGRIGVRVVDEAVDDALEAARREFGGAGLHEHADKNAVLLFVAPASRRFAVFGGEALHERVGDAFWKELITDMRVHFSRESPTQALEHAISRIGEELHRYFPLAVQA